MLKYSTDELNTEWDNAASVKTQMEVREKELLFMIKMLEDQLEFQRQRSNVDVSITDIAVKSEFQKRCGSE